MPSLIDHDFEAWLRNSGADRDWVRRNLSALRARFQADPNSALIILPPPATKPRDRYEEL